MNHGSFVIARRALIGLVSALVLALPAQAGAATSASISGSTLNVNGGSEVNSITVTLSGGNFVVADAGADVLGSGFCDQTADTPRKVTCPATGITTIGSTLGSGADKLDTSAVALTTNVNAGAGADVVTTGAGNDSINGDLDGDALDGGLGNDNLIGGDGGDTLIYTSHSAPVTVALGANQQSTQTTGNGQAGESDQVLQFEYLMGGAGNDTLSGDGNNNFISGGAGNDAISGGGGNDFVGYWERSENVSVQLAQGATPGTGGRIAGGESDTIAADVESAMGGAGDDVVIGNDSPNALWGGWSAGTAGPDGDDVLRGKGGADYLWGDQGFDTADYSDKTAAVTADADDVADDGVSGEGDNVYTDVENITGGSGNDTLTGTAGPNMLRGGGGVDTLNGASGADTLQGGAGADVLNGGADADRADYSDTTAGVTVSLDGVSNDADGDTLAADIENLTGGSGDDVLRGSTGANDIRGGGGNDSLRGGAGADTLAGGTGTDTADYSDKSAATVSIDGAPNDTDGDNVDTDVENLIGGPGPDTLTGDGDANALVGAGGADTLIGEGGDDTLQGGAGADTLSGGAGTDAADYSERSTAVSVSLDGTVNDSDGDTIALDVESATGGSGDDQLSGNADANRLTGGVGADSFSGGEGTDVIDGGPGADTFAERDGATDSVVCGEGIDSGLVDTSDVLSVDCESTVERPAVTPDRTPDPTPDSGTTPTGGPHTDPAAKPPVVDPPTEDPPDDEPKGKAEAPVKIKTPKTVRINSKGVLPVTVACTAESGACRGKIELFEENGVLKARTDVTASRRRKASRKRKAIRLGSRKFTVAAGEQKTVPLRLDRNGRRRVMRVKGRKKRRRGKIVITMKAPNGRSVTTVKHVTIVTPKARRGARRPAGRRAGR